MLRWCIGVCALKVSAAMSKRTADANRKFSESWTSKYFFIEDKRKCICLICSFCISVFKEYNLKRHFETKHAAAFNKLQGEERERKIESLRRSLDQQKSVFTKASSTVDTCVEVSYEIASLIAKSGRPFTDGDFAKKCIMLASEKVCPEASSKLKNISLNRMTVQRRIESLSEDIHEQMQSAAANFRYFSLAIDESTDVSSTAQLLLFVRGISEDFQVTEELVGLGSLKGNTTGSEILKSVKELCNSSNLDLDKLVSITTDGAPSMIGVRNGMVSLLKEHLGERDKELINYHCIIHQEQLCAKEIGFDRLMRIVTDAINFIRSKGLNHRQFKDLLQNTDSEHNDLVYYCEVRWLSRGEALKKFADLYDEVIDFLTSKGQSTRFLKEESFKRDLAFLVDMTSHLNDLNKKLMGKNQMINHLANAVTAFKMKLQLFENQLKQQNFFNFPYLQKLREKTPDKPLDYSDQIKTLLNEFNRRFQDFEKNEVNLKLFADPFSIPLEQAPENFKMELIDLITSDTLKSNYRDLDILNFFKTLPPEFINLKDNALRYASMFGSTYICEQTFSLMNINKSKIRNRLSDKNLESVLRVSTTNFEPDIPKLINKTQCHPSH